MKKSINISNTTYSICRIRVTHEQHNHNQIISDDEIKQSYQQKEN